VYIYIYIFFNVDVLVTFKFFLHLNVHVDHLHFVIILKIIEVLITSCIKFSKTIFNVYCTYFTSILM